MTVPSRSVYLFQKEWVEGDFKTLLIDRRYDWLNDGGTFCSLLRDIKRAVFCLF